ncbi:hypothetical protein SAMN05216505_12230 [Streptomyces prasinopilosus]|uniref:Uncharacterized protein n=2 Tax=Streptomyces prasinopilosus TaxID=67344 RepID=A0A1G7BBV4_9ACTN|nr:hypothetical protein SAMN05216505_12230 [Streptomyces prasinopilosus]
MPHHALDITLTRTLTRAELDQTVRTWPLVANRDTIRLMAVVRAKSPGKAWSRLRRQTGGRLPVDAITTHYPGPTGQVLLNVVFPPAAHAALTIAAERAGQPLRLFVQGSVHRALARWTDEEADRLDLAVRDLLAGTTPAQFLAALGRTLTRTPGAMPC